MRLFILGSAAMLLSGCSFLGLNGATNNISQAGALGHYGAFGQDACNPQPRCNVDPVQYLQSSQYVETNQYVRAPKYVEPTQYVQPTQYVEPTQYYQPIQYVEPTQYVQQPVAAPKCQTGKCLARWNIEGGIGPVFGTGQNIITANRTNNVAGTDFNSVSFADAYETGFRAELGGSYALSPNTKVTLFGHYEQADSAGELDLGTINGQQLTGALTEYESYGAEIGLRQYFAPRKIAVLNSYRPYVEARGGLSHVSDVALSTPTLGGAVFNPITVGGTAFTGSEIPLYEDSWVGTAAGLVGVETPISRFTTIGLETGVRYETGLKSDTSVLAAGNPFGGLNNNRGRVSIPLTLRGRYRF